MSNLFQAIKRPADDFLEARSSIINGAGGLNRAPKGTPHRITLVDHTSTTENDDTALLAQENHDSIQRLENEAALAQQPNAEIISTQAGPHREVPTHISLPSQSQVSDLEPDDPTVSLTSTISNESEPLLPSNSGTFTRRKKSKSSRTCGGLFVRMLQAVFSKLCCSHGAYQVEDTQNSGLVSYAQSNQNRRGYSALEERPAQPVHSGIFSYDPNVAFDVLYENQRGFFFFGTPLFSGKGLLNFDPPSWVDSDYKYSPVDISSAPVPDPSWEWVWKTWYIDMTADVDAEGWAYSIGFQTRNWHAAHVWFYSFVRRRRWIRKRKRIVESIENHGDEYKRKEYAVVEDVATEYFTIRSGQSKNGLRSQSLKLKGSRYDSDNHRLIDYDSSSGSEIDGKITNIANLLSKMKEARLDREKIEALEHFVNDGRDEIVLLSSFMDQVISFLTYQESRRELLRCLLVSYQQVRAESLRAKKGKLINSTDESHHPGHISVEIQQMSAAELATRRKALHDAIVHAKKEIMKLDYYSDRKVSNKEYAKADLLFDAKSSQPSRVQMESDRLLKEGLEEVEKDQDADSLID
ncbi:hypothetical protein V1514DRAFT_298662 [Lipomyces japonicus]|uniref:uncharacterized protein n=1 Tax=Lipomyces japonicus TaxID=56871 RepID=UPI0034CED437